MRRLGFRSAGVDGIIDALRTRFAHRAAARDMPFTQTRDDPPP